MNPWFEFLFKGARSSNDANKNNKIMFLFHHKIGKTAYTNVLLLMTSKYEHKNPEHTKKLLKIRPAVSVKIELMSSTAD